MCSLGLLLLPHTIRDQCDQGNCANRLLFHLLDNAVLPANDKLTRVKWTQTAFVVHLWGLVTSTVSLSLRGRLKASLKEVYIFQVLSWFFFVFVFLKSFLQLCLSSSSSQNKFSSKIAIKSLWKFISIVAAIWKRKWTKNIFKIYGLDLIQEEIRENKKQAVVASCLIMTIS